MARIRRKFSTAPEFLRNSGPKKFLRNFFKGEAGPLGPALRRPFLGCAFLRIFVILTKMCKNAHFLKCDLRYAQIAALRAGFASALFARFARKCDFYEITLFRRDVESLTTLRVVLRASRGAYRSGIASDLAFARSEGNGSIRKSLISFWGCFILKAPGILWGNLKPGCLVVLC